MEPVVDHQYLSSNGLTFHTVQAGPQDGPLAILLHGFPETWRSWKNQIDPLAEAGLRVMAPDQRGYALSDKPKRLPEYRLDKMAGDVIGLMEAVGVKKASLVGHDWGGIVAWVLAALHPERVEKLVVLNAPYPAVAVRSLFRDPMQWLRSSYALFFQLPVLPEALLSRNNYALMVRGLQRSSRPGAFDKKDFDEYRQAWAQKGTLTAMLNWYRAFVRRPVVLPSKPRIQVPTLIIWGAKDAALGRKMAQLSVALCEKGELVYLEQASHWVQHEEPGVVNNLISDFLSCFSCSSVTSSRGLPPPD